MSKRYFKSFLLFILLAFCLPGYSFAQASKFVTKSGSWKLQSYAQNIVKITFTPIGYTTDENITNAVNMKPANGKLPTWSATDSSILIGGKVFQVFEKNGYRGFIFLLSNGEILTGGGERAISLNRRGHRLNLYNTPWYGYGKGADNLNFSVPFFTSSTGYGLFFDNASKGYADIGKTDSDKFETGFLSGELNFYLITGNYKDVLSGYYKLTGTQPLPPRWAMGNFMSRFGYASESQTKSIAAKMKQEQIPFDAIIFDLFWFGDSIKGTLGNLDWMNRKKWPDPKKMIGDFKKQNIQSILIAEPFVLKGTKNYGSARRFLAVDSVNKPYNLTDFYFGYGGLLDIFRKDAGDWIWNNHYQRQIRNGVHAWWTDLGEPEKHPADMWHNMKSLGFNRLMKADEVHNAYGHYWNKMLSDHYTKYFPNQRLFHLNRSGFAGSQRYSIFPWSGDVSRSWDGLQAQLPVMLGMSMSGIPYIHADAGGFAGGEGDQELYVRWLQFAAFTPIFRPHGTALFDIDTNAFSFPSEPALMDSPWRAHARRAVRLRYAMLPYNYTLAYLQASAGQPLVAPLYYHYPGDTLALKVEDEFMWGENILVAPVLEKAAAERTVYLPKGNWYRLNTAEIVYGSIIQKLVIEEIPVFVKAGSFIPTAEFDNIENSKSLNASTLAVTYYADTNISSGLLYRDDGESKQALATNKFELISFKAVPLKSGLTIRIQSNNGRYQGRPSVSNVQLSLRGINCTGKTITVNGKQVLPIQQASDAKINFEFSGKTIIIRVK